MSRPDQAGRERDHEQRQHGREVGHDGREGEHDESAPVGVKSSLASTLKPWMTDDSVPHGPIRLGPMREASEGDDLHLHEDDHEGDRHGDEQDRRRGER